MWVQRILEFIGREPAGIPVDWEAIEREIGAPLPPDCKELSEAFGGGLRSDTLTFLACAENQAFDLVTGWRSALAADRDPHLIGSTESGKWPILARAGDIDRWHTFETSTSEFLYRVLRETGFHPFGIAQYAPGATFEPGHTL